MKTGILFLNFGGPTGDAELVPFLRNLLSDVLPGPTFLKRFMANRIAPARANRVRENYTRIGWSPLVGETLEQVAAVRAAWGPDAPPMAAGMMFTAPTIRDALRDLLDQGADRILAVGLFPHWSFATSGGAYDMVHHALQELGHAELPVHYARAFFEHPDYIESLANTIRVTADQMPGEGPIELLFSAHGVPLSYLRRGDPYPDHVRESCRLAVAKLGWSDPWHLAWQSRLGPVKWLGPSTPDVIHQLGVRGAKRLLVVPVSFVGEHIETLDEIDREYVEHAHQVGLTHVARAPALGLEPAFIKCLVDVSKTTIARFGATSCSRCLIPQEPTHRHQGTCPQCKFVFPPHLSQGKGGIA